MPWFEHLLTSIEPKSYLCTDRTQLLKDEDSSDLLIILIYGLKCDRRYVTQFLHYLILTQMYFIYHLCIIQSTLPFQGEIFPVLYNQLYHFREIFPVLPCIILSTLIPERYFLYCSVLYNPLYHFREIFPVLPCNIQSTLPFQGEIFPVLPCIIQSTLPFQGDISCIALYYTIHSIISGRYFLYYTIHSIISGKYFLTLLYW